MTAVEWLLQELNKVNHHPTEAMIMYAKKLEKQQIIDAFDEGKSDGYKTAREWDEMVIFSNSEQYYNETFKK